ncbi:MAG TPA: hypothetical protein EYG03_05460 [Planctomycetes bacterium]|nr:hypothetical protein [Planctomycetota bacterium]
MSKLHFPLVALALPVVFLSLTPIARAEIVPRSQKQLESMASHVVNGEVKNIYSREERKGNFEYTHFVAEIAVRQVSKGKDLAAKDRVYVRYWRKVWLGRKEDTPSDPYGQYPRPTKGDVVDLYLQGNRAAGHDVAYPNGFYKITTPSKKRTTPVKKGDK